MDSPIKKAPKTRRRPTVRPQIPEIPINVLSETSKSATDMVTPDPDLVMTSDEDEDYSVDIANAVAAILESAAQEVPDEPIVPNRVLSAQASKSKKKIAKTKSSKSVKPKRSKSTIYPGGAAAMTGSHSKSRISLHPIGTNGNVAGRKSKSRSSASIDALNLDKSSHSFQAFDDAADDPSSTGSPRGERADGKSSPNTLALCGFRPFPPAPLPKHPNMLDLSLYMGRIVDYFKKLGYNNEGEPKIRVNTKLSLHTHIETARHLVRAGEQIKCLHALVLGIYFTNSTPLIERFTINFKSITNGKEYKHIVLGLYMFGAFGALGISRDPRLQDKPTIFTRLADLLSNFCQSYTQCGHELVEIKVGGIISRDPHSLAPLPFRLGVIQMRKISNEQQFLNECDKLGKLLRAQMGPACLRQIRPPELCLPIPSFDERKSLLSSTGITTTLTDESSKLISKLREISNETSTTPKPSSSKSTKLQPTKASPSKKKVSKK